MEVQNGCVVKSRRDLELVDACNVYIHKLKTLQLYAAMAMNGG